jgi:hypothetical protein
MGRLRKAGYGLVTFLVAIANKQGSLAARTRVYFLAYRLPKELADLPTCAAKVAETENFIQVIFKSMHADAGAHTEIIRGVDEDFSDEGSIEDDDEVPKKMGKGIKYKEKHFEIFAHYKLTWPPTLYRIEEGAIMSYTAMFRRVQEIAFLVHKMFEVPVADRVKHGVQFYDGNLSLERLLSWDEIAREPKTQNPWKSAIPTITAHAQIIARFLDQEGNPARVRQLSGKELMHVIGYPMDRADDLHDYDNLLLTSLAGNAFSGFSACAVSQAGLLGAGDLGLTGASDQELAHPDTDPKGPATDDDSAVVATSSDSD